jgi:hypothetical protein
VAEDTPALAATSRIVVILRLFEMLSHRLSRSIPLASISRGSNSAATIP